MHDATLAADWNAIPTARPTARQRLSGLLTGRLSKLRSKLGARLDNFTTAWWQTLEQVAFALFMGGLVTLLVLLYSDILII
jgi:hypothetical protein